MVLKAQESFNTQRANLLVKKQCNHYLIESTTLVEVIACKLEHIDCQVTVIDPRQKSSDFTCKKACS
uniref:Uncharacterized protein n=1 Tax=Magnetococcus massalia (strain MO-1) TaxID=451514 RepID=A0A1S7LL67_MAGMO|nr:protein of unknown function [Candidatus Magnetococcus massalia]